MAHGGPFEIIYAPEVREHMDAIKRQHHSSIRDAIKSSLSHEPESEARNRKPLVRSSSLGGCWELRCGAQNRFRVFYLTNQDAREVHVLAIGEKQGNRLQVGGKEFTL